MISADEFRLRLFVNSLFTSVTYVIIVHDAALVLTLVSFAFLGNILVLGLSSVLSLPSGLLSDEKRRFLWIPRSAAGFVYGWLCILLLLYSDHNPGYMYDHPMVVLMASALSAAIAGSYNYVRNERAHRLSIQASYLFMRLSTSRPVLLGAWALGGAFSGFVFSLLIAVSGATFGIPLFSRTDLLLITGTITGALTAATSVLNREKPFLKIPDQVIYYSSVMDRIGTKKPEFLEQVAVITETDLVSAGEATSREVMERKVPYVMLYGSSLSLLAVVYLLNGSQISAKIDPGLVWLSAVFLVPAFLIPDVRVVVKTYFGYQKWRLTWLRIWNLIRLLSLPDDLVEREVLHLIRRVFRGKTSSTDLSEIIGPVEHERDVQYPKEPILSARSLMKVIISTYSEAPPGPRSSRKWKWPRVGLVPEYLKKTSESLGSLRKTVGDEYLLLLLGFAIYLHDVPPEVLRDVQPLVGEGFVPDLDLSEMAMTRVSEMEESPKRVLPDSLRWLPVVYGYALWLGATLLGI